MGFETAFLYLFYLFIILVSIILAVVLSLFIYIKVFFYKKSKVIGDKLKIKRY